MQRKIVFNTCNLIDIQYFVDVGFRNDSPRSAGISLSCSGSWSAKWDELL